jgi:hypothetical protein
MTTRPNRNYSNPPVDSELYFSNGQTVTADAASTSHYDAKAANCFPSCNLVLDLSGIGAGEALTVTVEQDDNASFSSPVTVLNLGTFNATTPTEPIIVPLSNTLITERYVRLYYDVTSGDSIPVNAWLTV